MSTLLYTHAVLGGLIASEGCLLHFAMLFIFGVRWEAFFSSLSRQRVMILILVVLFHMVLVSRLRHFKQARVLSTIVLAAFLCSRFIFRAVDVALVASPNQFNQSIHFHVNGMGCTVCRVAVKTALTTNPGLQHCSIEQTGGVICYGKVTDRSLIFATVRQLGFAVGRMQSLGQSS